MHFATSYTFSKVNKLHTSMRMGSSHCLSNVHSNQQTLSIYATSTWCTTSFPKNIVIYQNTILYQSRSKPPNPLKTFNYNHMLPLTLLEKEKGEKFICILVIKSYTQIQKFTMMKRENKASFTIKKYIYSFSKSYEETTNMFPAWPWRLNLSLPLWSTCDKSLHSAHHQNP